MIVPRRKFLGAAAALVASNHPALAGMLPGHQGPTAPESSASQGRSPFAGIRYDPHVYEAPPLFLATQPGEVAPEPAFRVAVASDHPAETLVPDVRAALGTFDDAFRWSAVHGSRGGNDFHLWFAASSPDTVRVGVPAPSGRSSPHWVEVQALGKAAEFALPAAIHTVLATACVPGLIGVDFEDVRTAATLGSHGVLALAAGDPDRAISGAYGQLADELSSRKAGDSVAALLSVLLTPRKGGLGMRECRQMVTVAGDPAAPWARCLTDGCSIFAAPLIEGGEFVCAALAITRPPGPAACL